jgi:hypothetical protein
MVEAWRAVHKSAQSAYICQDAWGADGPAIVRRSFLDDSGVQRPWVSARAVSALTGKLRVK